MKPLKDGALLTFMENFYMSKNDHERAMWGATIIGYLECVLEQYIEKSEEKEEKKI